MRHPDDYPELALHINSIPTSMESAVSDTAYDKSLKETDSVSNLELGVLVGIALFGLGVLAILGYLDVPIVEQVKDIPISIVSNTNTT